MNESSVDNYNPNGWDETELSEILSEVSNNDNLLSETQVKFDKLQQYLQSFRNYQSKLDEANKKLKPLLEDIEPELKRLAELKLLRNFLIKLDDVNNIHLKLNNLSRSKSKPKQRNELDFNLNESITLFSQLRETFINIKDASDDNAFKIYCKEIILFWKDKFKTIILPKFKSCLDKIKWPMAIFNLHQSLDEQMTEELLEEFKLYFHFLLKLDTKHLFKYCSNDSSQNSIYICLPLTIMIEPLKKRFIYHFLSNSRTNQLGKPEWYFTQILNWIKDHQDFLTKYVDPILAEYELLAPSKIQFTCALLELLEQKLKNDLPKIVELDDQTFSHVFDEILQFNRELELLIDNYSSFVRECYNLLSPFAQEPYFSRLKKIEEKRSWEFLETIFSSDTAWIPIINPLDEDDDEIELQVPEIADNLVLMLQSITDRFTHFLSIEPQLAFVKLQLNMLDDFRLRLCQVIRMVDNDEENRWPFSQRFFSILNALNYFIIVLEEWKTLQIFQEMSEIDGKNSIFDDPILVYNHMLKELQTKIVMSFMNQFKAKIFHYANSRWHCLTAFDDEIQMASYELFYFISKGLELLKRNLSQNLFDILCVNIAEKIKESFFTDLIAKNSFNSGGAEQLHRDISINLLSVFRPYSPKPEALFPELIETYRILNFSRGVSLLLQEALSIDIQNVRETNLKEHCINHLSAETVLKIISKRLYL